MSHNKEVNYGISIMKVLMAFLVINCHFASDIEALAPIRPAAVTVFMTTAFFFMARHLEQTEPTFLKKRITRLAIPYIIWPLAYLTIFVSIYLIWNIDLIHTNLKNAIFYQFAFGHSILQPMWFQWALMILTTMAFLIYSLGHIKTATIINVVITVLAITSQYSGLNNFWNCLPYEMKYPLGRLVEMIPYYTIGLLIGHNIKRHETNINTNSRIGICLTAAILTGLLIAWGDTLPQPAATYNYAGIRLLLLTLSIFTMFYMAPVNLILEGHDNTRILIEKACRYTMGIYCVHILVGRLIELAFDFGQFANCLVIYTISYAICLLIDKTGYIFAKQLVN